MTESPIQRIAGIDLGSNSLKLAIAAARADLPPKTTIKHRIPLRLATDAFDHGRLMGGTIDRLIDACRKFSEILERIHIEACRTVATEAFRRVENAGEVIDRIREASGLAVEVLTPEAEIRLVLNAIRTHLADARDPDLLVDLGGGSLEICAPAGEGETDLRLESHALGLAAQFETFLESRPQDRDTRQELCLKASEMARELTSDLLDSVTPETVVLSGGQAAMLDGLAFEWNLWDYDDSTLNGVSLEDFKALCERAVREETLTLISFGIPPDRASMLAGAAAFYHTLAVRSGATRILIPRVGLMDGLLQTVLGQGQLWPPATKAEVDFSAPS
ncbi:hypothetical protein ACFL6R_05625 [Gemmatimonadota bacterium]